MGYKFQFITLAGFHQLNYGMFELARGYKDRQMAAYSELQQAEFAAEVNGYTATKHQREVGTGYFDASPWRFSGGKSSTTAMKESTEHDQFRPAAEITKETPPAPPTRGRGNPRHCLVISIGLIAERSIGADRRSNPSPFPLWGGVGVGFRPSIMNP